MNASKTQKNHQTRQTHHGKQILPLPALLLMLMLMASFISLSACGFSGDSQTGDAAKQVGSAAANGAGAGSKEVQNAKTKAVKALSDRLAQEQDGLWVYKDYALTENHYTQREKMAGENMYLVHDMDENWREDPYEGDSCIRCEQTTEDEDWGGWMFMNGYLPANSDDPEINDGQTPGQGLDLTGATELKFMAKGETGEESVEFFTAGFGYDGDMGEKLVKYPDTAREQNPGAVKLTTRWKEYTIPLEGLDLRNISCGFGYVMSPVVNGERDNVFYLDAIRFTGDIEYMKDAPIMLRSFGADSNDTDDTEGTNDTEGTDDTDDTNNQTVRNAAFTYDNALAAMAFLSEGEHAKAGRLLDAMVYGVEHDPCGSTDQAAADSESADFEDSDDGSRNQAGRIRNAYAAGDIRPFPGWDKYARLSGWYDSWSGGWQEDRYQVGSSAGNTSCAALAMLQYDKITGEQKYQKIAQTMMDWVIAKCSPEEGDGFTAGFDGWAENDPPEVYDHTYKSVEHNIDAYAAFARLYEVTKDAKYRKAADSALSFVKSMYEEENGWFCVGTCDDGETRNDDVVTLDSQVWAAMALGDEFVPYEKALDEVADMKTEEGGYPFCAENANGGWWAEGTAYTALMYALRGDADAADQAMDVLSKIQLSSGLFPAATVDDLSTGMYLFDGSPWEYNKDPHIAPTAWFIMAANGFNPYVF